jgi:energy-coupling factor transporter ATP-binding protein EcfA2
VTALIAVARHDMRKERGLMTQNDAGGSAPALRTDRLGRRYGHVWGLRDCTLEVPAGAIAGLVGPNGAGKTTLLEMIIGLLEPTEGQVSVFGETSRAHGGQAGAGRLRRPGPSAVPRLQRRGHVPPGPGDEPQLGSGSWRRRGWTRWASR